MPPIRTLLWIGPGESLARLQVTDTPTLDVVWIDGAEALRRLPPIAVDAIVIATFESALALQTLVLLRTSRVRAPALVLLDRAGIEDRPRLLAAGADALCSLDCEANQADIFRSALEAMIGEATSPGRAALPGSRRARAEAGPPLIGTSRALRQVEDSLATAAASHASVLVQGETGSGKEIVARRIHAQSARHAGPFVAANCAAFADTLLESELFGHRRGAFTGADRDRTGLFERAQGGIVFLDEIGETSAALQASLLRVLQEREVLPVGGDRPRRIDVRVVAATHRDLAKEIEAGRFREDLFYRLAVLRVDVPALRDRPADVAPLSQHFLETHGRVEAKPGCQLSPRALRLLERYPWPGNVRELENEIQRLLAQAVPGELITAKRLSPPLRREPTPGADAGRGMAATTTLEPSETLQQAIDRTEADLIRDALHDHDGRKARTARWLGVTREGLYKKMKRLGVE